MFDSDSDDNEFLGFQNSWKFKDFHPRRAATRFWTEEMWKHIVDETNRYVDFTDVIRVTFLGRTYDNSVDQ